MWAIENILDIASLLPVRRKAVISRPVAQNTKRIWKDTGMFSSQRASIIAREYVIPAVVSVNGAMGLDHQLHITVDAHKSEMIIIPE